MTDFSTSKFYCSLLYKIMAEAKGKSPFSYWQDAVELLAEEEAKYEAMTNKESKPAAAKLLKIEGLRLKVAELSLTKDEDILSEGCKGYLCGFYAFLKYKKWSTSEGSGHNASAKGKTVEDLSISLINRLDGTKYSKNKEKFTNDYLIGYPDIVDRKRKLVVDVKSSWDIETFIGNVGKELDKMYWWQAQGYMDLLGFKKAEVSFCLVSTPEHIIQAEIEKRGIDNCSVEEIRNNLTFDDIPENERRIKFLVERDDEAIQKIKKRIIKCREYLSTIEGLHLGL